MKKIVIITVALIMMSTTFLSAGIEPGLKHKLKNFFNHKKFALLEIPGIPVLPKQGLLKKGITLSIHNGGRWQQKRTLGMVRVSDLKLKKGELLQIRKLKYTYKGIVIHASTFKQLPTGRQSEYKHLRVKFIFTFDESYLANKSISNFRFITKSVERYFTFFNTPEKAMNFKKYGSSPESEATIAEEVTPQQKATSPAMVAQANTSVKLNMTISEVEKLLGAPLKRSTEQNGAKLKYDYGDITVIFTKGKVVSVVY